MESLLVFFINEQTKRVGAHHRSRPQKLRVQLQKLRFNYDSFCTENAADRKLWLASISALKSSESKLFNAGSTIKIGHFLDDINPSEIKVWKIAISASTKFTFRKQINENEFDHLENGTEFEPYQPSVNYVQLKCELLSWSHLNSSASQTYQISCLQFEAFCHSKIWKILIFTSIVYEGSWQIDPQFEGT